MTYVMILKGETGESTLTSLDTPTSTRLIDTLWRLFSVKLQPLFPAAGQETNEWDAKGFHELLTMCGYRLNNLIAAQSPTKTTKKRASQMNQEDWQAIQSGIPVQTFQEHDEAVYVFGAKPDMIPPLYQQMQEDLLHLTDFIRRGEEHRPRTWIRNLDGWVEPEPVKEEETTGPATDEMPVVVPLSTTMEGEGSFTLQLPPTEPEPEKEMSEEQLL